jgi:hypothetical protein
VSAEELEAAGDAGGVASVLRAVVAFGVTKVVGEVGVAEALEGMFPSRAAPKRSRSS